MVVEIIEDYELRITVLQHSGACLQTLKFRDGAGDTLRSWISVRLIRFEALQFYVDLIQ